MYIIPRIGIRAVLRVWDVWGTFDGMKITPTHKRAYPHTSMQTHVRA